MSAPATKMERWALATTAARTSGDSSRPVTRRSISAYSGSSSVFAGGLSSVQTATGPTGSTEKNARDVSEVSKQPVGRVRGLSHADRLSRNVRDRENRI